MPKRRNEDGITLLELIVVIAVLGVISTGIITATKMGSFASASSAADKLDAGLEQVKTLSMTKSGEWYLKLYKKEDGYYAMTERQADGKSTQSEEEKLGNSSMAIEAEMSDGSVKAINDVTLYFSFDRASGAFCSCKESTGKGSISETALPKSITVTAKGRKSTIKVVAQTGKHYVDEGE